MGTLTLRLEIDPTTKKKNVWVKYDSDADALPAEHEEEHKRIVEALLRGGTIKAEELGTIHIEREGQGTHAPREQDEASPAAQAEALKR